MTAPTCPPVPTPNTLVLPKLRVRTNPTSGNVIIGTFILSSVELMVVCAKARLGDKAYRLMLLAADVAPTEELLKALLECEHQEREVIMNRSSRGQVSV